MKISRRRTSQRNERSINNLLFVFFFFFFVRFNGEKKERTNASKQANEIYLRRNIYISDRSNPFGGKITSISCDVSKNVFRDKRRNKKTQRIFYSKSMHMCTFFRGFSLFIFVENKDMFEKRTRERERRKTTEKNKR